jgi:methylated-DNA-protein-cysteine methyltransferase-like protein
MRYIPDEYQQEFYRQVWSYARLVPIAKVATYGQIAKMLERPFGLEEQDYKEYSARWVGDAMAACPNDVPWQRIINAQGKVSKRVDAQKQKVLLEQEGVVFIDDKLNMSLYQWDENSTGEDLTQASLF